MLPKGNTGGRQQNAGPPVMCRPATALTFSMVVHELATNAVKYGALLHSDGRLAVSWRIEGEKLLLDWREHSARPIEAPAEKGLGTKLIERQMRSFPGAKLELDHPPEGLQARFVIPFSDLFVPAEADNGA